jgi:predicted ATPase
MPGNSAVLRPGRFYSAIQCHRSRNPRPAVRNAAYESLLLARRRDWHERIGRAIEEKFPETAANDPELLAHHFGEAGLMAPACDYRERSGDRAAARSAYREAIAHYSAGLDAAGQLADPRERRRRQLAFLRKLGPAQTIVAGAQSTEVEATYRRERRARAGRPTAAIRRRRR